MADAVAVKNTLAFLFPRDADQPNVADMACFIKTLKGDQSMMETAYKISDEKSVFIRFKCQEAMNFVFANNAKSLPFHYNNGKKIMVRMTIAGNTRYVRVFDLPPEISDDDLTTVFEKYGTVKRTIRERFPAEFQLNMYTGIRGVYIDIDEQIPEVLLFRNRKGRVYYEGVTQRCFVCKSVTHLKKSCPVQCERQKRDEQSSTAEALEFGSLGREQDEADIEADTMDEAAANSCDKKNKKKKQKAKKAETKRQRSLDSDPDSASVSNQAQKKRNKDQPRDQPSSSDGDISLVTVPDAPSTEVRYRVATYEWIEDESEKQLLIAEDKQRIAEAAGVPLDRIVFYHD